MFSFVSCRSYPHGSLTLFLFFGWGVKLSLCVVKRGSSFWDTSLWLIGWICCVGRNPMGKYGFSIGRPFLIFYFYFCCTGRLPFVWRTSPHRSPACAANGNGLSWLSIFARFYCLVCLGLSVLCCRGVRSLQPRGGCVVVFIVMCE